MATKTKKTVSTRPVRRKIQPKVEAEVVTAVATQAPKRQKWAMLLGLLVAVALIVQGAIVYMGNKKKDVTLFFESQIAARGEGKGEVLGCRTLAVDSKGNVTYVYGVGEGSVMQAFSADGKLIARYEPKKKAETLNNVFSVAYGPDDTVWACERGSGRVLHFSAKLAYLSSFQAPSNELPGIAVDSLGQIWVASYGPKVYVFDPSGTLIKEFKGTAQLPILSSYRMTFDPKGNLLLLDISRGQGKDPDVKIYAPDGKPVASFVAKNLPFNEFSCIAVDHGYVVLNDNGSNAMDSKGMLLFNYKGKVEARANLTSNQLSLSNIPGLAIGIKGHWAMDMTPVGRGCDRFSFSGLGE